MQQPPKAALATVSQVAAILQVSIRTVYRLIESGELKPFKIGRLTRIPISQVYHWIENQSQSVHNPPRTEPHDTSGGVLCKTEKRTAMASINGQTVRSTGHRSPTQVEKELDALLGQKT